MEAIAKTEGSALRVVYELSEELKNDPQQVIMVQALTKDSMRAFIGLKGTHGLFGSDEWWENIKKGVLPTRCVSGTITRMFVAGQDGGDVNEFELSMESGSSCTESIYVNDLVDRKLFKTGCKVEITYVFDELKLQPAEDGGVNYSKIVLKMAVG